MISLETRLLVRQRAGNRCEYCQLPQTSTPLLTFHVEHVVALQHGGSNDAEKFCLACPACNRFKGPILTTIDHSSQSIVRLFNPRSETWDHHFLVRDGRITGKTRRGKATVRLLQFNSAERVRLRRELMEYGDFS